MPVTYYVEPVTTNDSLASMCNSNLNIFNETLTTPKYKVGDRVQYDDVTESHKGTVTAVGNIIYIVKYDDGLVCDYEFGGICESNISF